jgi:hypothetical protein
MSNKRQQNKPRRRQNKAQSIDLVIEARAGLIPASDDVADERRARMNRTARVVRTIKAYAGLATCGSEHQAITDILADLRHYCDCEGLAFYKLYNAACALYLEESDEAA